MRHFLENLNLLSNDNLVRTLATIPVGVTALDLSYNDLGNKTGAELAQALAAIPAGVTALDLRFNSLGNKTGAELTQALAAIPAGVTALDLRWNSLANKAGAELAQAFTAIPAGVASLDLSSNKLDIPSSDCLSLLRLPHIKVVYLSLSEIEIMDPNQRQALRNVFSHIDSKNIVLTDSLGIPSFLR